MTGDSEQIRKRVWVQNVAVKAAVLEVRLSAIRARSSLSPEDQRIAEGAEKLVRAARAAAFRDNPIPSRWAMWWRGTLIEAAYQNLHAAEVLLATLFSPAEVRAEIPEAVARAEASLERNDPRRGTAMRLLTLPTDIEAATLREHLRKVIEVSYAHADELHARLRSFRNLVLGATAAIAFFMLSFVLVVWANPTWVPMCFTPRPELTVCPTGSVEATSSDIVIIALLGVLGGTLAAAVSISRLKGTSTPYNVPTALALLKVPFGAMTAIGSIIVIRGGFVPGLSALDSQVQILAYALLFGYGQELLTRIIDRQAQVVLNALPSKEATDMRPEVIMTAAPEGRPAA
jgi:hypothetical protein